MVWGVFPYMMDFGSLTGKNFSPLIESYLVID